MYTDNGQHFGDHRIPAGKRQAYETDVLVPFLVRGPGIPKGSNSKQIIQSVDLAPTFLDMAKATDIIADDTVNDGSLQAKAAKTKIPSYPFDGKSMLPLLVENSNKPTEHQANKDYNDFRWAALLELYSGSSNIGIRYNYMKQYYKNHMVRAIKYLFVFDPMLLRKKLLTQIAFLPLLPSENTKRPPFELFAKFEMPTAFVIGRVVVHPFHIVSQHV